MCGLIELARHLKQQKASARKMRRAVGERASSVAGWDYFDWAAIWRDFGRDNA